MSCDASSRADTEEREKIFFLWLKKIKIGKTKSKDERTESDVPSKIFDISSPFLFSFFLLLFLIFFVFIFPIEIKIRGVCVGGNERKRECRKCFLLFVYYLLQYVFFFLKER